jgi:hypothetical protein
MQQQLIAENLDLRGEAAGAASCGCCQAAGSAASRGNPSRMYLFWMPRGPRKRSSAVSV